MSGNNCPIPAIRVNGFPYFSSSPIGSVRTVCSESLQRPESSQRPQTSQAIPTTNPTVVERRRVIYNAAPSLLYLAVQPLIDDQLFLHGAFGDRPSLPDIPVHDSIDEALFQTGVFGERFDPVPNRNGKQDYTTSFERDLARSASWFPEGYTSPESRNSGEQVREDSLAASTRKSEETIPPGTFADFDSVTPAGMEEEAQQTMRVPLLTGAKPWPVRRALPSNIPVLPPSKEGLARLARDTLPSQKMGALMTSNMHDGAAEPVQVVNPETRPMPRSFAPTFVTPTDFAFAPSAQEQQQIVGAWRSRMLKREAVEADAMADRTANSLQSPEAIADQHLRISSPLSGLVRRNAQKRSSKPLGLAKKRSRGSPRKGRRSP